MQAFVVGHLLQEGMEPVCRWLAWHCRRRMVLLREVLPPVATNFQILNGNGKACLLGDFSDGQGLVIAGLFEFCSDRRIPWSACRNSLS